MGQTCAPGRAPRLSDWSVCSSRLSTVCRRSGRCDLLAESLSVLAVMGSIPPLARARVPRVHENPWHAERHRAMPTYLVSRYSSMPSKPPSRPKPDCLTPPNGAAGFDTMPVLTPIIPNSIASATRITRVWSLV